MNKIKIKGLNKGLLRANLVYWLIGNVDSLRGVTLDDNNYFVKKRQAYAKVFLHQHYANLTKSLKYVYHVALSLADDKKTKREIINRTRLLADLECTYMGEVKQIEEQVLNIYETKLAAYYSGFKGKQQITRFDISSEARSEYYVLLNIIHTTLIEKGEKYE